MINLFIVLKNRKLVLQSIDLTTAIIKVFYLILYFQLYNMPIFVSII